MAWKYPFSVGLLLGTLQTSYFLGLNFLLASTYESFLLVTIMWLIGVMLGFRIQPKWALRFGPMLSLIPNLALNVFVRSFPFHTELWPFFGALIMVSGTFSGVFFNRFGTTCRPVRALLFVENGGFIIGVGVCTLAFLAYGYPVLMIFPSLAAILCLLQTPIVPILKGA